MRKTASYFDRALSETNRKLVGEIRKATEGVNFDTVVGTGLSGTIFAARVAPVLGKHFAIVRKPDDRSTHSDLRIEGTIGYRWIFVDDFLCSGATMKRTMEEMTETYPDCEFSGYYTYRDPTFVSATEACRRFRWAADLVLGPVLGPPRAYDTNGNVLVRPSCGWNLDVIKCLKISEPSELEVDFEDYKNRPRIFDWGNKTMLDYDSAPQARHLFDALIELTKGKSWGGRNEYVGKRLADVLPMVR